MELGGLGPVLCMEASAGCSFIDNANCNGCCWRRSTTSFQSSRSCFTRSNCDSMCCCEICNKRRTLWSAFLAIISKMLRNRCEHRCLQALSTRKDMFSALTKPGGSGAHRQRCSQRFRNILDMIAKKADHSVLRLLQISQQHIESQLERVKHERELWKEVVERRQQQPLQLALSMKEQPADAGKSFPATSLPPAPQSARGFGGR